MKVMKKASIVSVGNEILSGETVDTNAAHLSRQLMRVGIGVVSSYSVVDEVERIAAMLKLAADEADIVLVTGGLGPTRDDVTREGLAELIGVELEFRPELLEQIAERYSRLDREMPETNRQQAFLPAGARALPNAIGTAPGVAMEWNGTVFFAMPGVPSEMKRMFAESVLPELDKDANRQVVVVRKLRCFGTGESNIAEMLGPLMDRGRNPLINCTCGHGVITLHVVATADDEKAAVEMARQDEELLRTKLGQLVFGAGEQTLAEVVGEELRRRGATLAVAESCTGGLIATMLTDVPGSSEYLKCGWVTYSNEAKTSELGVDRGLIEKHGAVSEEVAAAMSQGALDKAGADYAIGITGIAGPEGGSDAKPVGLVFMSVASRDGCEVWKRNFPGGRASVRYRAAHTVLNLLRLKLHD